MAFCRRALFSYRNEMHCHPAKVGGYVYRRSGIGIRQCRFSGNGIAVEFLLVLLVKYGDKRQCFGKGRLYLVEVGLLLSNRRGSLYLGQQFVDCRVIVTSEVAGSVDLTDGGVCRCR